MLPLFQEGAAVGQQQLVCQKHDRLLLLLDGQFQGGARVSSISRTIRTVLPLQVNIKDKNRARLFGIEFGQGSIRHLQFSCPSLKKRNIPISVDKDKAADDGKSA